MLNHSLDKIIRNSLVLASLLFSTNALAATHESIAIHTAQPSFEYASGQQQNRFVAALKAKNKCKAANIEPKRQGYCELVRMDDVPVTPASELKPNTERYPLFLWRFVSDTSTVYIAGSLHLLKEGLYPLPNQYEQAFNLTSKLVLEVNTDQLSPTEIYAKTQTAARLTEQRYLRESFSAQDYSRLAQTAALYGVPLQALQSYKPAMVYTQLSLMGFVALGYEPDLGVEEHFSKNTPPQDILQLESLDLQLSFLFAQSMETQIAVLMDTVKQFDAIETVASRLVQAWATGDDATMASLITEQNGDSKLLNDFSKQLLDNRNEGMSKKIAGYLNTNESYFVLVGAAHLAGPNSIIKLLEKSGIYGERIYSDQFDFLTTSLIQKKKKLPKHNE
tara:strand:+ start:89 stop:1261 length:1173 start_codon:yes stop_codon:yes gene_type:complete